jgi:hypothetical protein
MLRTILAISGRPGLYKLISQGKNMLIVETVDEVKKRIPVYGRDQITSLGDIAMYTDADEIPLREVLSTMKKKENGEIVKFDVKKASKDFLRSYFAEILPNFDRERVHDSDIKKLISWYNILVSNNLSDFEEEASKNETES